MSNQTAVAAANSTVGAPALTVEYAPVSDFRRVYGLGNTKSYELFNAGLIRVVKLGGRTLVHMPSARAYFESLPMYAPKSGKAA